MLSHLFSLILPYLASLQIWGASGIVLVRGVLLVVMIVCGFHYWGDTLFRLRQPPNTPFFTLLFFVGAIVSASVADFPIVKPFMDLGIVLGTLIQAILALAVYPRYRVPASK